MGACYSVVLRVKVNDEKSAILALNEYIKNAGNRVDFKLEEYAKYGIGTETFNDLVSIFLADWPHQRVTIRNDNGFTLYLAAFNASYGWETVLEEMFTVMSPYLENESEMVINSDTTVKTLSKIDGDVQIY